MHVCVVACALAASIGACRSQPDRPGPAAIDERREAAYAANNRGVALLEQFAHDKAAAAFREALELDPALKLARINLPIALFYAGRSAEAESAAAAARDQYPDAPQPIFLLGLIARADNRAEEAIRAFQRVLALDPEDPGAKVNLAQVHLERREYDEAAKWCESALAIEPYNATAAYNLALARTRGGDRLAGQRAMARFLELRTVGYAVTYSQTYLEQGRYAEAVTSTGAEPDLAGDKPAVVFADATSELIGSETSGGAGVSGGVTLGDVDADGDLDLIATGRTVRVLRNDGRRLIDLTRDAAVAAIEGPVSGAIVGDINNDARPDLLLLRETGPRLLTQDSAGVFHPAPIPSAATAARAGALVDVDHDGDLDLFVGRLVRNNGNGTFADITAPAGLAGLSGVVGVAPTDFDNRRDLDLLVIRADGPPKLFRNLRNGSFEDVASTVGLPGAGTFSAIASGDVNKDGYPDFLFAQATAAGSLALSDGRGRFRLESLPPASQGALAVQLLDADNDGLLDFLLVTPNGPRIYRRAGGQWQEYSDRAFSSSLLQAIRADGGALAIASGDIDLDGDVDVSVLTRGGTVRIWRNDGGNTNRSLRVRLAGRVSNRSGVGAKVEVRAGSLYQKIETVAASPSPMPADIVFGLGGRSGADAVRVLWPSGTLQSESALEGATRVGTLTVAELDRKPSSCPYLYTWNGRRFEFVTDFLGGGEMGYWAGPGESHAPDPDEYVRISDDQLTARDGRLEIRITNELEEVLFLDQVELLAVTHSDNEEVYPDEGLRGTPRRFRSYATWNARAPLAATDDRGRDVRAHIAHLDRRYVDGFDLLPIRGYSREHAVTLDLAPGPAPDRTVLLMTGWTDYAFSSDNVAAHQAGLTLSPPALQMFVDGGWRTIDPDMGVPVGRPQTLVVDVTRFLTTSRRFRVATTMRVYWDRILVASAREAPPMHKVPRLASSLRWRGFSAESTPDGREPFGYDYERVAFAAPWKLMPGRYTREGDVQDLVARADDRFVIARPGDELVLSFDAAALPALSADSRRTFFLYAVGYSKEMDLHSASPDVVRPIPFRRMSRYPYPPRERYPHEEDFDRYHTRVVGKSIPILRR